MPGLVPGIHVLSAAWKGVDGRDRPGHDAVVAVGANPHTGLPCRKRGEVRKSLTTPPAVPRPASPSRTCRRRSPRR
ncbi:hypothetical protein E4K64_05255 [Bradyrhizobium frederickii]|uniref:Uncharacterized protein n=1 Tax=Bradyrhizobium frederickii TaxID=2560054 RepID=A0A4Y9PM62_9BRAD|nr:hypothetical protein E4K64_05255 [Bradyrhizobium frederickii]